MKVIFHTNLDSKYSGWHFPEEVCCKPEIGDYVESTNDDRMLKVCTIVHCFGKILGSGDNKVPYLKIELTKRI